MRRLLLLALCCPLVLGSCTGNVQTAGVSGGGTGAVAAGTVSGFGSVVVDGQRWDDADADVVIETAPGGAAENAALRLGQRLEIDYEVEGTARTVTVKPVTVGPITSVATDELTVAGQRIRVNADPDAGPVTLFEGVATLAELVPGEIVEVHGARVPDSSGRYRIQASRIEKLAALPGGVNRVAGIVEGLNSVNGTFRIGDLVVRYDGNAGFLGDRRTLANGAEVTVWSALPLLAGPTLQAQYLRVRHFPAGAPGVVAGVVTRLDRANRSAEVDGVAVRLCAGCLAPAGIALAEGQYAVVRGTFDANGLVASELSLRRRDLGVEVSLRGSIASFVSLADFRLRGVRVDASSATVASACGGAGGLRDGLLVELEGVAQPTGVLATRISCNSAEGEGVTIEFAGTLTGIEPALRRLVMATPGLAGGPVSRTVFWTTRTRFAAPLTAASLGTGQRIRVSALIAPGPVLIAREISAD